MEQGQPGQVNLGVGLGDVCCTGWRHSWHVQWLGLSILSSP